MYVSTFSGDVDVSLHAWGKQRRVAIKPHGHIVDSHSEQYRDRGETSRNTCANGD